MGCIARFPVEEVMSAEVAEQKLGGIVMYQFRSSLVCKDPQEWFENWIKGRSVLAGWETVKNGVVKSFRMGRVRHIIIRPRSISVNKVESPKVELCCSLDVHSVFNWKAKNKVTKNPVLILSPEQAPYFRLCKKCEAYLAKMLESKR